MSCMYLNSWSVFALFYLHFETFFLKAWLSRSLGTVMHKFWHFYFFQIYLHFVTFNFDFYLIQFFEFSYFVNLFYNQNRSLIIKRLRTTMLTSYTILTYMYLHKKWFQKIQRYNHHTLCFKHFKIFQYSLFYLILLNVFEWNTFEGLSFFFLKYHNFYT